MKKVSLFIFLIFSFSAISQDNDVLRVAFWNLENFFDPFVDSTKMYNEYTPQGAQRWTLTRFYKKRNNLYKAILSFSDNRALGLLGLCEVENTFVTTMLFQDTPLKKHNYRCVHYESRDRRGIDVALMYSIDKLTLIYSEAFSIKDNLNKHYRSRDILYAKFCCKGNDTLHCFVNHWPSRYGGERETIYHRCVAARHLRGKIDSLIKVSGEIPKIIVMGDFNDTPYDKSIVDVLKSVPCEDAMEEDTLINLFSDNNILGFEGTLKHKYSWQTFDQIMISKTLLHNKKSLHYKDKSATIFHENFLFIDDDAYGGKKLFRTYVGPKYHGGYSDHLPVYMDLIDDG